jgi:hypothetical protein
MKLMLPIALMMAWVAMVALTMADFAGFYRAMETARAAQAPARETRTLARCRATAVPQSVAQRETLHN